MSKDYDWTFKHFSPREMACRCGCGMLPQEELMQMLQMLRAKCGFPLKVVSGARCPSYNHRVSKTGHTGPHTMGLAVDVQIFGAHAFEMIEQALSIGFTGLGLSQRGAFQHRFIHLDCISPDSKTHPRPWVWSY